MSQNYLPVQANARPAELPPPPPLLYEDEKRERLKPFNYTPSSLNYFRSRSISFPQIPTFIVFFPRLRHELVVAYDAHVYWAGDIEEGAFRTRFYEIMGEHWQLKANQFREVSFSKTAFWGHGRDLATVRGMRRVKGYVFFHRAGNLLFVSWRVVYVWRLSPAKLALVSTVVSVVSFLFWLGINLSSGWGLQDEEWVIIFFLLSVGWSLLGGTIGVLNILSGGFFLGWLREKFDELFRDDVNLMNASMVTSIEAAAIQFDLERVRNVGGQTADFSRRVPRL